MSAIKDEGKVRVEMIAMISSPAAVHRFVRWPLAAVIDLQCWPGNCLRLKVLVRLAHIYGKFPCRRRLSRLMLLTQLQRELKFVSSGDS